MTAHTPGPWFVHEIPSHPKPMMSIRASGTSVCVVSGVLDDETEAANARLIAAAPDLLAALEAAVQDVEFAARLTRFDSQRGLHEDASDTLADELDSHIAIYRAAIAKAKGGVPNHG